VLISFALRLTDGCRDYMSFYPISATGKRASKMLWLRAASVAKGVDARRPAV
jgi:hypothetical protein